MRIFAFRQIIKKYAGTAISLKLYFFDCGIGLKIFAFFAFTSDPRVKVCDTPGGRNPQVEKH